MVLMRGGISDYPVPKETLLPPKITTKKHRWMKMTYEPVEVITQEGGEPVCFPISGEPIEGISCFDCYLPITADNVNTECQPQGEG